MYIQIHVSQTSFSQGFAVLKFSVLDYLD